MMPTPRLHTLSDSRKWRATIFAVLIATAWAVPSAQATDGTWTMNVATDSIWNTTTNWLNGIVADGAGSTADFTTINLDQATNQGVVIDGAVKSIAVGTFLFGDKTITAKTYLISGTNGGTLTFDNNGSNALLTGTNIGGITISAPVILEDNLVASVTNIGPLAISGNITSGTVRGGQKNITLSANGTTSAATITLSGGVNNAGSILNNGTGAGPTTISGAIGANVTGITQNSTTSLLTLSGDNSAFGGTINLTAGTLKLGGATSLGTSTLNIADGTTLTTSASTQISSVVAQNWNGGFTVAGGNTLNLGTGAITLGANVLVSHTASGAVTFGGAVTGTGNLSIDSASGTGGITFSGAISHTGNITTTRNLTGTTLFSGNVTNIGNISFAANGTSGTTTYSGLVNNTGTISDSASGASTANFQFTGGIGTNVTTITHTAASGTMTLGTGAINNSGLISNTGGALTITGNLGSTVTGVTQNSATGSTTLSGTNTSFAGPINLTAGTLKLGSATALGGNGTTTGTGGALTIAAGTTIDTTSTTSVTTTTVNAQTWNGNFTYGGTGSLTFGTGAVTMGANVQLTNNGTGRNYRVNGNVTSPGAANLTINNSSTGATTFAGLLNNTGTITLAGAGTGGNTFSGGIGSNVGNILNSSAGAVTLGTLTAPVGNTGTITNEGTGSASFTITGALSNSVTSLIQNSATSKLIVNSDNTAVGTFLSGTGTVQILQGTFQALGNGGSSIVFGSGNVFTLNSGATLELNNTSPTMAGINDGLDGGGSVTNVYVSSSKTLNIKGSGVYSFSGGIANSSGAASTGVAVALTGGGQQTFAGDHTYTGATAVNLGTFVLSNNGVKGSLGGTNVTVGNATVAANVSGNATLQVNGNYTIGSGALGTLILLGGNGTTTGQGTLNMVDGGINTLTLSNSSTTADVLKIGGVASSNTQSILSLEVGTTADRITVSSGKVYFGPGLATVNIAGLGNLDGTTQTLISGVISATSSFKTYAQMAAGSTLTTSGNFGGRTVSLGSTTGSLTLIESAVASAGATVYWNAGAAAVSAQGGTTAWNSFVNGNTNTSNFATDSGGTTNAAGLVDATTDVTFLAAANTTLGQDFSIKSLTYSTPGTVVIGGSNTLTLNGNGGNGITVSTGAGNNTVSSKVALGNSQTWTVTDSGTTLTASNEISGSGSSLTKAGAGTLILSGANTYTGGTTVSAGTLLVNNLTGSGTGTGALSIGASATLGGSGIIGGVTTISGTLSPGNSPGILTFTDAVTLETGSTTLIQINAADTRGTDYDGVNFNGGLTVNGGALTFNISAAIADGAILNIFEGSALSSSFTSVTATGTGGYVGAFAYNGSNAYVGTFGSQTLSLALATGELSFIISAIPEPSTYAAIFGVLALGFAACRRRSKKA